MRRSPGKREPKSFRVEVKRGARRAPPRGLLDPFDALGADRPTQRADAVEPTRRPEQAKDPVRAPAPAASPGRILPSLIEPVPTLAEAQAEEEVPAAPPRRRGRKPGSKNRPKPAPALEERDVASEAAMLDEAVEDDGSDEALAAAAPPGPEIDLPAMAASDTPRDRPRLRSRSRILARYVLGSEPLAGERWVGARRRRKSRKPVETQG